MENGTSVGNNKAQIETWHSFSHPIKLFSRDVPGAVLVFIEFKGAPAEQHTVMDLCYLASSAHWD